MDKKIRSLADFQRFEREFPVENISFLGIQAWGAIRVYLYYSALNLVEIDRPLLSFKHAIASICGQWWTMFQKHKFWVLTSSDQRKFFDERWYNALDLSEEIRLHALFIELPNPQHKTPGASKKVISRLWFYVIEEIIGRLAVPFTSYSGKNEFDSFCNEIEVDTNFSHFKRKFVGQFYTTFLLAKLQKPKAVFLTTHYTNMPRIAALKRLKIPVYEIQHGLISKSHPGYNPVKTDARLLPDTILTYGEADVNHLKQTELESIVKFVPIGHFYIDQLRQLESASLEAMRPKTSRYRICVTAQDAIGIEFIDWMNELQQLLPEDEVVLIPRKKPYLWYIENGMNTEIAHYKNDTYHIIRQSDIHATVYSTCAIEALAFDVPNILMNIGGQAAQHFGEIAYPTTSTWIANSPKEFCAIIESNAFQQRKSDESGEHFFKHGFKSNLQEFIEGHCR